jgi:hypothetical protein
VIRSHTKLKPVTADLVFRLDNDWLWDTVVDQTNRTNSLKFTSLRIEYAFSGVGRDSLYTLNTNSTFNLDGVNDDTDPLFTPDIYPTMVAAADRNTYNAIAKGYDLEFANFERIYAGNCSDDFTTMAATRVMKSLAALATTCSGLQTGSPCLIATMKLPLTDRRARIHFGWITRPRYKWTFQPEWPV